ncbi:MAG: ABC transporter permease [Cyclobacteriaceae bacterium]
MNSQGSDSAPLSIRLIRWLCKPELAEEIEGNLIEYRLSDKRSSNFLSYWLQVISYLRPSMLKKVKVKNNTTSMFQFNPLLALRNLFAYKTTTLINIFGFTLGLTSAIFLYFYISAELKVDSFHTQRDKIYRVLRQNTSQGALYNTGVTSGFFAGALNNDYPDLIQQTMRAYPQPGLISYEDHKYNEEGVLFSDAGFFEFFSYPLLVGDASNVLDQPDKAVISAEYATKYFGNESPIGKTIKYDHEYSFIVSGIFDKSPAKSHLEFDIVLPISHMDRFNWFKNKWSNGLMTYVMMSDLSKVKELESQFPFFMDKYFGEDFEKTNTKMGLVLEKMEDIYFNNDTQFDRVSHGDLGTVLILVLVGCAVLFIASFNYINLSIAQSFKRAKEVSIRKVLGVNRLRLLFQFIGESSIVLLLATAIAILTANLLSNGFQQYFGLEFEMNWFDSQVLMFLGSLNLLILLFSAIYPAMVISGFKPLTVLKGMRVSPAKNHAIRKSLVTLQFAISIFMIAVTLLITSQLDFITNKPLGFKKEAIVLVSINNDEIRSNMTSFKNSLLQRPEVLEISSMSGEPGGFHDASVLEVEGREGSHQFRTVFTDEDYLSVFDIKVIAGRNFEKNMTTDENAVIINQNGLKALNLTADELLGQTIDVPMFEVKGKVIGIAEDYHFTSLKDPIEPIIIARGSYHRRFGIKLNASSVYEVLEAVEQAWQEFSPNYPIQYRMMEDSWYQLYETERRQADVFKALSGMAVVLACMGVFGLVSFTAQQRQKEFGIRKVLGASGRQILQLISREFVLLTTVGTCLALPFAYYFMAEWLDDFSYRIEMGEYWYLFLVSGLLVAIITFVTIAFKTYKTSVSNPVDSIRYE